MAAVIVLLHGGRGETKSSPGRALPPCCQKFLRQRHEHTLLPITSCPCCFPGRDPTLSGPGVTMPLWEFNTGLCPTVTLSLDWHSCSYHLANEEQGNKAILCTFGQYPLSCNRPLWNWDTSRLSTILSRASCLCCLHGWCHSLVVSGLRHPFGNLMLSCAPPSDWIQVDMAAATSHGGTGKAGYSMYS